MLFTSNSKLTKPKPLKFSRDFNETVIKLTILNFGFFSRPSFHSIVKIQTLSLFSFLSFLSFFLFFFFDLRISQFLIHKTCHNYRTNPCVDMKIRPKTKNDKKNMKISRKSENWWRQKCSLQCFSFLDCNKFWARWGPHSNGNLMQNFNFLA